MVNHIPSLPVEVCEMVIDFLREDQESLHSCLLTCRAWVPWTIYHLYTSVRLSSPTGLSVFLQSIHLNPGNAQFVRCLSLKGCSYREPLATRNDSDELMVTAAIRLPRILTSLREIEIIQIPENVHPTFPRLLSQFQATTQLSLKSTTFTSFNEFKQHVLAFPNLKRLCLIGTIWRARRQLTPRPVDHLGHRTRSKRTLEHVKIYYDYHSDQEPVDVDLINWLLTTATTSTLVELSVGTLNIGLLPTLNDLLSNCRNSLHTLEIYCNTLIQRQRFDIINLRNNIALRDLRIYDVEAVGFASLLLVALPPLRSLSIRLLSDSEADHGHASQMVTSALTYGHLRNVENIRIGLVDITNERRRYEFRVVSKLFELRPRVVFTDYSEDDLQRYISRYHVRPWIDKLNDLSRCLGHSDALTTRETEYDGIWTVTYKVSGTHEQGTSRSLDDAKQMAAYRTYCALITELCACSPDEYRQKYSHIFE